MKPAFTLIVIALSLSFMWGCAQADSPNPCVPETVPGEIIVELKDASRSPETRALIERMESVRFEKILFDDPDLQIWLLTAQTGQEDQLIRDLMQISNVATAEANQLGCFDG
ncbi:hypothetical protein [Aliiroseovarius sp. 2305UL8-7]|uniref:hypothetical protein n=1 Tax=Aliiroseovarius conchicola TaxID=3121637 RepID=UPI00352866B1